MAATFGHAAECVRVAVAFNDPLGLAEKLWARVGGPFLSGDPKLLLPHRASEAALTRALGEERYLAARDAGAAHGSTLELAADFLPRDGAGDAGPLTQRQADVARLVAGGKTNKGIAAELAISPRTVAVHVDHILRTPGSASRVQIGVWFASRD
ncbi:DNA-binding NarL/FixJ family response regulator [Crossiella equi]|uniref:DNA-binding NarL/FixJ family response regulator n=1 Tax=Crossiella equi TaxID=130796 RepID=A0ABS5AMY9_9PSEU|nr:LuxR C-terminal-related transcriptional regulator [Crossiella equi]MBP2477762.1 DNA-binding NarL/FixJ family response regulator [Crossiella equi]